MPIRLDPRTKQWFFRFTRKKKSHFGGGYRLVTEAKEAERIARNKAVEMELYPEVAVRDLTFREAGNEFLENSKKHKRSWKNDVWHVSVLIGFFRDAPIRAVTAHDVEA